MKDTIHVSRIVIPLEVLGCLTSAQARRFKVLPVAMDDEFVSLVMQNPDDDYAIAQIEAQTHRAVRVLKPADPDGFELAIYRYYPENRSSQDDSPLGLFEHLVNRALQLRCSDIHIDPEEHGGCVRLRIDGMMRVDRSLEPELAQDLVQAVKVAANLDIAEKRVPQDGQISLKTETEDVSMRVATVPTLYGEKVTLRLLATAAVAAELAHLDALGMTAFHHDIMMGELDNAYGMILLSGPTGSGKTTTLYAGLRHLRAPGTRHILSIEDPVEIPLGGINQVHIDSERVSFNGALRSALRHDPDVIMIGEIRDGETADIAVKAAMTGHLMLSTVHTNDAAGVIGRLLNLGVARDQLTATLRLAVAQRLVRCPCPHCVASQPPQTRELTLLGDRLDAARQWPMAKGCALCGGTGYAGRTGLYEMIPMDSEVRDLIHKGAAEDVIAQRVFERPAQHALLDDGVKKAANGQTTLSEILRVAYMMGADE